MVRSIVFFLCFSFTLSGLEEKPMVIVIPSYNNIRWYLKNIYMTLSQNYENYRVIYIDDCSSDGTSESVIKLLSRQDPLKRVTYQRNSERKGAMANIYYAVQDCRDDEIVVLLDGDDWFYHKDVLKQLNEVYTSGQIWFTHGTLIEYPNYKATWCQPYPSKIIATRKYRSYKCPSHLRTFYAWLFKKIRLEDLCYEGEFLKMTWDMAIMYPLSEMADERHAFIEQPNYVYNMANPINDNKVDPDLQNFLDRLIRQKEPYPRLEGMHIPVGYEAHE